MVCYLGGINKVAEIESRMSTALLLDVALGPTWNQFSVSVIVTPANCKHICNRIDDTVNSHHRGNATYQWSYKL